MNRSTRLVGALVRGAGSLRLALLLVLMLAVVLVAGAVLPQLPVAAEADVEAWQTDHHLVTAWAGPLGLFRVSTSPVLILLSLLLAINTAVCTFRHAFSLTGRALSRADKLSTSGFLAVHASICGILVGCFVSAGFRFDGNILLTEGQSFTDEPANYVRKVYGPFAKECHSGNTIRLEKIHIDYANRDIVIRNTSTISQPNDDRVSDIDTIDVNHPLVLGNLTFTVDQTGFSPKLVLRHAESGRSMGAAFVALSTLLDGPNRTYRDLLPIPLGRTHTIATLYPDHDDVGGEIRKSSDEPRNPILLLENEEPDGSRRPLGHVKLGERLVIGPLSLEFADLRRWNSFKVVHDPGYPIVIWSLWIGAAGLLVRYLPEIFPNSAVVRSSAPRERLTGRQLFGKKEEPL